MQLFSLPLIQSPLVDQKHLYKHNNPLILKTLSWCITYVNDSKYLQPVMLIIQNEPLSLKFDSKLDLRFWYWMLSKLVTDHLSYETI